MAYLKSRASSRWVAIFRVISSEEDLAVISQKTLGTEVNRTLAESLRNQPNIHPF
jgi:hypothetical protein